MQHITGHNAERPFPCTSPGCTAAFKSHYGLHRHMLIHNEELPYRCTSPDCNLIFRYQRQLTAHMRFRHSDEQAGAHARGQAEHIQ